MLPNSCSADIVPPARACTASECTGSCVSVQCVNVRCISVQCFSVQCFSVQCFSVQCVSVQCVTQRAESAVAADVNWNQHIIPLKTLVYCTVCCILPPINQGCVESYNRQSSTEGVACSSGKTSTAQNLRRLPTHSEQVVSGGFPLKTL